MRIRVRFVLVAIILLITMVPEFRIYSVSPNYKTKPIGAGRILESFYSIDAEDSLVIITHKDNKLNAYSDKMLDKLIASFEMPGKILDWQSEYIDGYTYLFTVLNEYRKTRKLTIFKVNKHSRHIVQSNSFIVSDVEIVSIQENNGSIWMIMQDGTNKISTYDLTGNKTSQIETKILNYVYVDYGDNGNGNLIVYNGKSLTKYAVVNGVFVGVKSISSFEVNSTVQINDDYKTRMFTMLLFDRKEVITFDSDLNVLFMKQVPDVKGRKFEGGFLDIASGSMFVTDYVDNIFCFDAKGYKYKKLNTDGFWWPWYLYEGSNSFGLLAIKRAGYLSPRIVDDFGFLDYIAFSGLPKDIQYVMTASDEYGKYWIYAYTMKDIYMIPSRSSDDTTFSIKTINVSLPTNQNLLIDWVPYWVGIAIIILAVLAKGFLNVVERLF